MLRSAIRMKSRRHVVITAVLGCHLLLLVPVLTSQLPPRLASALAAPVAQRTQQAARATAALTFHGEPIIIEADQLEKSADIYKLRGAVVIFFRDYTLHADEITFDSDSGQATATGHLQLDGGDYNVHLQASHGNYDANNQTGQFYDVTGTTGMKFAGKRVTLTTSSPFAFSGKEVDKVGPDRYIVHHGTITSCELPKPKWTFNAERISFDVGDVARIYHSTFRVRGLPIVYLPFAEHPVEHLGRQSGFLVPTFGQSSVKGTIVGDSFFWAINRSMDATLGAEYFSKRGFAEHANFRAKTADDSFVNMNYFGVLDRGFGPTHIDEGGEDIKIQAEQYFPDNVRAVANVEYLSSFLFRLAFAETFTTAVNSEVKSDVFAYRNQDGYSLGILAQRYQNFQSTNKGDYFSILHVPSIDASSVDRALLGTPLNFGFDISATGLSRRSPTFSSANLVGRLDAHPRIALPVFFKGWTLRPAAAVRDTFYSQHKTAETQFDVGSTLNDPLNRRAIEGEIEVRPPRLERIYEKGLFGHSLKHTLEPSVDYRIVNGVDNFLSIIRFDSADLLTNTNEVEYGVTNRIYLKPRKPKCDESAASNADKACVRTSTEFLSWEVAQKYFFDPNFGGAVVPGVRNVFETTADFTGVAFLTEPRNVSPVISRLRIHTSAHTDVQWLLDYDTKKGFISSSDVFVDYRLGSYFFGGSHALLRSPGEVFLSSTLPAVEKFNQFRLIAGYGNPSKRGLNVAGNVGYDVNLSSIQYDAVQTSYNWDCCGLNFEYRRFVLGPVRNESQYRFAFSLANIGTFGNLKRQERLY